MLKIKNHLNQFDEIGYYEIAILILLLLNAALIAGMNNYIIPMIPLEFILMILVPIRYVRGLFLFLIVIHFIRAVILIFGYYSLIVAFKALSENLKSTSTYQISYIFLLALALVTLIFILVKLRRKKMAKIKRKLLIVISLIIVLFSYFSERYLFTSVNIIGSEGLYLKDIFNQNLEKNHSQKLYSKTFSSNLNNKSDYYLFIIESLGVFNSTAANDYIYNILKNNQKNKVVNRLEINTTGSGTVGGELRELCSISISSSYITEIFFNKNICAGNMLKLSGYKTIAITGGSKSIFNRPFYYSEIGFDYYISGEDLKDYSNCGGGWAGAPCDIKVINGLPKLLEHYSSPKFVYYLTINTHFPYKSLEIESDINCHDFDINDKKTCVHFKNLVNVFKSISLLASSQSGNFYIVGDHSPPFLEITHKPNKTWAFEIN